MRVLMLGPDLDVMGGVSSVARTLLDTRTMAAHQVTYLPTAVDGSGLEKAAVLLRAQRELRRTLRQQGPPDLFHIHVAADTSFYRKLWFFEQAIRTGRPVIVHVHGALVITFYESNPVHAAAIRWMYGRASRVIAIYPRFAEIIHDWTDNRARALALNNPIVLRDFDRPADHRPPARPTVLFMGILGQRKGTWDLLGAIPKVLESVPDALFRFGGNGEVQRLESEARRMGISRNVEVLGWLRGDQKLRAFREAHVYCLPSYNEVMPVSVLEAMGASLPVVSTTVAGIPECVVDGETGYLIEPGDRASLANRLTRLLSDPALAERMGQAGRRRAETHFDDEVVAKQLVTIWQDAIGG